MTELLAEKESAIVVGKNDVLALQSVMGKMPQAPGMPTKHFFAGGMYCRRVFIPAGNVVVSRTHKSEHFFIGCSGELNVAGEGENYTLRPGDVRVSAIGTKRVVFALTDVIVMTIHKTNLTNLDELEKELVSCEENSMYDANNQPKKGVVVEGELLHKIGEEL